MTVELLTSQSSIALLEGEELKMVSGSHGGVGAKLTRYLDEFAEDKDLGHVVNATTTYNFKDGKPKRMPDASFIPFEKLAELPNEELTVVPDLVAEVVSTNDTAFEIYEKISHYQSAGVKLIWIIYPVNQSVHVFRLAEGSKDEMKSLLDDLDGENILPGFKLPIKKLFRRIAKYQ